MLERARFLWERLWNSRGQNQGESEVGVAAILARRNLGANPDDRIFCRARAVLYLPRVATSVPLLSEIQWEGKHPRGSPDTCLALIKLIITDHSEIVTHYAYQALGTTNKHLEEGALKANVGTFLGAGRPAGTWRTTQGVPGLDTAARWGRSPFRRRQHWGTAACPGAAGCHLVPYLPFSRWVCDGTRGT